MGSSVPIFRLVRLFCALFLLGTAFTIPLFKFDLQKFVHSSLFVKIAFWIPIFLVFVVVLYVPDVVRLAVLLCLLIAALVEFLRVASGHRRRWLLTAYFALFCVGMLHFVFLSQRYPHRFVNLMIVLCLATVLSDVGAFFCGSYLGRHKLPSWLNDKKSWEGVAGQLIGALIGVVCVNAFVIPVVPVWTFIPLGLGCALGDLANSWAKRNAAVKDWSGAIPGHGGFIDRLSSMAGSCAALFYFLLIIRYY